MCLFHDNSKQTVLLKLKLYSIAPALHRKVALMLKLKSSLQLSLTNTQRLYMRLNRESSWENANNQVMPMYYHLTRIELMTQNCFAPQNQYFVEIKKKEKRKEKHIKYESAYHRLSLDRPRMFIKGRDTYFEMLDR